jgi:2-polyprenyl-6-methoxyphenol hydroxylase-like FAD-dependent oxidoreductase
VVANFACERSHANTAYQWFQGGPVLALLPLPGKHVSMVWSLPTAAAPAIEALEADALCREVEAAARFAMWGICDCCVAMSARAPSLYSRWIRWSTDCTGSSERRAKLRHLCATAD